MHSSLIPPDFDQTQDAAWDQVRAVPGFLTEREARFLMLVAACAPTSGPILEIGSFKGRSTVALGFVAKHYGFGPVIAVDPHTSPSETDPNLRGQATSYNDFLANIQRAGVADIVEPQRMFSRDYAPHAPRALRVLWIDGDHTLQGVREDVTLFKPHLQPGAFIVMHDVLGTFPGSLRVFCEDILDSDDFGPAGFCGSIGWAQYLPSEGAKYRHSRQRLAFLARQLLKVVDSKRGLTGLNKLWYKLWRPLVPHRRVQPERWVAHVVTNGH
ncbi:MAG TPA: class I SAM-dependent methyltransferase [Gemmatimonadaceae bacterium]|nr:class I SAM-dependent methyltransferase [Gemmatimonadaceae bacterium]